MNESLNFEEQEIEKNKEKLKEILLKIINKGSNYVIRGMPINNHIKEILINTKEALKEEDFNNVIKIAITSSIKEGLEILGKDSKELNGIENITDIAFNGGLVKSLNLGVDMVENMKKYGNLFYNYIEDFFESLKGYIAGKDFKKRVYEYIGKCLDNVESFKDICSEWYDAYDEFDIKGIKEIAGKLKKMKNNISFDNACLNENALIQNATELISRNNKKLTPVQFDICANIEKI